MGTIAAPATFERGGNQARTSAARRLQSPVDETRQMIAGREGIILAALGIPSPARGWHICCPLPYHDDKDPSFRFCHRRGKYYCTCMPSGIGRDILDLIQDMGIARGVIEACDWARGLFGAPMIGERRQETVGERLARERHVARLLEQGAARQRQREIEAAKIKAQQLASARAMFTRSVPARGTPAEAYLRGARGIECALFDTIRYIPPNKPHHHHCMLVPFGLSADEIGGVHLTLLKPDGSGKADVEHPKLSVGIGHNLPLVLVPAGKEGLLFLSEGIEDALSAHQATGAGAWAAGGGSKLGSMAEHIPASVKTAIIRQDDNEAGRSASHQLGDDLVQRGVSVFIHSRHSHKGSAARG